MISKNKNNIFFLFQISQKKMSKSAVVTSAKKTCSKNSSHESESKIIGGKKWKISTFLSFFGNK